MYGYASLNTPFKRIYIMIPYITVIGDLLVDYAGISSRMVFFQLARSGRDCPR